MGQRINNGTGPENRNGDAARSSFQAKAIDLRSHSLILEEGKHSGPRSSVDGFIVSTTVAQNGSASRADFQSHAVVQLAGGASVYDPSYGQYFPTEQAWRDGMESVFVYGCVAAQGKSDYSGIVNSIWAAFQSRSIARVDGAPMRYWGSISSLTPNPLPDTDFTTAGLIKFADGRCEAWAHFLVDVWGAQGIAAEYWAITPNAAAYANAPGVQPGATLDGFVVRTNVAQNGMASKSAFQNHAVVKLAGGVSVYDPSYGQYFANEQAWRDGMESLFVYSAFAACGK